MTFNAKRISKQVFRPGLVIKLVISLGLCVGLYYQLFVQHDILSLWQTLLGRISVAPLWMLRCVVLLVPLNLLLEALKFRLLLPARMRPPRLKTVRRICAGLSVGLFTPNRIGEYLGRLTGTTADQRIATIAANLLGGMAQWIALLSGG